MNHRLLACHRGIRQPALYPLCTERDTAPHAGQTASTVRVLAWMRTDRPTRTTRSIVTAAR